MENLSAYLKRFTKILSDKSAEKSIFCEVVSAISPKPILPEQVSLREGVVYLVVEGAFKNFIFMHKKEILYACKERGLSIIDLR